jgi:hypothetical protein
LELELNKKAFPTTVNAQQSAERVSGSSMMAWRHGKSEGTKETEQLENVTKWIIWNRLPGNFIQSAWQ